MAKRDLPSPELLRKLLRYEPDTGKLFWRERTADMFSSSGGRQESACKRWNTCFSGREALGCVNGTGAKSGSIFAVPVLAHRVAWAVFHGRWPDGEIDHINGVRVDNRIVNLRDVDGSVNNRNAKIRKDNSSGYAGVYKQKNRYLAHIRIDGKQTVIGRFDCPKEAHKFREAEKIKYGYHKNHGRK